MYNCVYIYIERERETYVCIYIYMNVYPYVGGRLCLNLLAYLCVSMCLGIYIERERERVICVQVYRKQTRPMKDFPRKDLTECGNLVSGPLSARRKKVRYLPGLQNEIKQTW